MNVSIDPSWHDKQIEHYTSERKQYKSYAKVIEKILTAACRLYAPLAIVQVRAKDLSSFAEKAVRKANKYNDPVHQFTDLCGARVITQTQVEVDRISQFIHDTFTIDVANSIDKRSTLGVSEFGYLSVHYIIQLPMHGSEEKGENGSHKIMGIELPEELVAGGFKAEIQVRTMLQHAWAGISHDSLYKNMFKPPEQWHREMNRLAATLEEADHSFARFVSRLETYAINHGAYLPENERQAEIETLKMILDKEPKEEAKVLHALRIAGICKAAEEWKEVVTILTPYESKENYKLMRELGYALCRASKETPNGIDYQKGIMVLKKSCQLDPMNAQTHYYLSWVLRNTHQARDSRKVHEHLAKAYELQPSNPYYLATYLENEILLNNSLSHISMMRPTLLNAIETCKAHVEANIEIPHANFTIGRFYLYLKMPNVALLAYLDGLRLCLCEEGSAQYERLQAELDFLYQLERLKDMLPGYDAALRLFTLASFIKSGCLETKRQQSAMPTLELNSSATESETIEFDPRLIQNRERARENLIQLKTRDIHYPSPMVIVAGSCAAAEEPHMQQYQDILNEALRHFEGTVFSGGTLSGIGQLIGNILEPQSSNSSGHLKGIAYLPCAMPAHSQIDTRYCRHIYTQGQDFSSLEPLQMWIDLLASDIDPRQVKLLGIGGGDIASLEYRLATVLGAQVGIVQDSGREADSFLNDPKWNTADSLVSLPKDRMSVKVFITHPNPIIPSDRIEEIAGNVHESFRQERMKAPRKALNLQPWENLMEDFKNACRDQVTFSVEILRQTGFCIEPAQPDEEFIDPGFTQEETEFMAELEHGRWNIERLKSNWRYGKEKDEAAQITPYLVPWDSLSNEIKEYDREAVRNFPTLLWRVGLKTFREVDLG